MTQPEMKSIMYGPLTEEELAAHLSTQITNQSYEMCINVSASESERENWRSKWANGRMLHTSILDVIFSKYIPESVLGHLAYPPFIDQFNKKVVAVILKDFEVPKEILH